MANDNHAYVQTRDDFQMALDHAIQDLAEVLEAADQAGVFTSYAEVGHYSAALSILRREPVTVIATGNPFDGMQIVGPLDPETFNCWADTELGLDKLGDWTAISVSPLD